MKLRSLFLASLLGLSSTFAIAQTAAISAPVQQQLDAAIAQGNTSVISQLAASNPQAAVTIAERVAAAANARVSTNPIAAASLAAAATSIVTSPAVTAAVASNASVARAVARVTATATSVVASPAVRSVVSSNPAAAAAVNTVVSNASSVVSNPSIQAASPGTISSIVNNVGIAQGNVGVANRSTVFGSETNNNNNISVDDRTSGGGGS